MVAGQGLQCFFIGMAYGTEMGMVEAYFALGGDGTGKLRQVCALKLCRAHRWTEALHVACSSILIKALHQPVEHTVD